MEEEGNRIIMRINPTTSTCCGCSACVQICSQTAITMQPDNCGFLYPAIDLTKCIDCGACERVCVYQKPVRESDRVTFAAVSTSTDLFESASGGLFAAFAKTALDAGGVVYGCALLRDDERLHATHIRIDSASNLYRLLGSKYVQSDICKSYQSVKQDLTDGKTVLFSGTPCQVNGLRGFLGSDYDELFTIDIVCHGVPSQKLFYDYIAFTEEKLSCRIDDFRFRDKSEGWKLHGRMTFRVSDGTVETQSFEPEESSYYQMFLNGYTYRENCYTCPYAGTNRPGDITIGDYWCIDLIHPELLIQNGGPLDEAKGISCLIVNRKHGSELLTRFGDGIKKFPSSYENAARYNGQLLHPTPMKPERKEFLEIYRSGYGAVEQWYLKRLAKIKMKRKVRSIIPKPVKIIARKLLK